MDTALKVLKRLVVSSLVILLPAPILGWLGYSTTSRVVTALRPRARSQSARSPAAGMAPFKWSTLRNSLR